MRPSLKIETWNLLSELGRTKSLAQAAERLDMDLPAASRLVSSLEKELGVEILDRKKKTGADRHEIAGTVFRSRPHSAPISASAENRRVHQAPRHD